MSIPDSVMAEFWTREKILATPQPVPAVYLVESIGSVMGDGIQNVTHSTYTHCFTGLGFGVAGSVPTVVDQVKTLRLTPLEDYLGDDYRLKCVELLPPGWGDRWFKERVASAQSEAKRLLRLHWWQRSYDWLGVLGQGLGLPGWFGIPGADWCSESLARFVRPIMVDADPVLGMHPTPAQTNVTVKRWIEGGRAVVRYRHDSEILD